jgi:hypothetical protein
MKYIIVFGNPVDGFTFVGPYNNYGDAMAQAEKIKDETWWIANLIMPEK